MLKVPPLVSGGAGIQNHTVWGQGTLEQYTILFSGTTAREAIPSITVSPRNPKAGIPMSLQPRQFLPLME